MRERTERRRSARGYVIRWPSAWRGGYLPRNWQLGRELHPVGNTSRCWTRAGGSRDSTHGRSRLFLGIDVGTQGARWWPLMRWQHGRPGRTPLRPARDRGLRPPCQQDTEDCGKPPATCLSQVVADLARRGAMRSDIAAAAVTSTSGTVVLLDAAAGHQAAVMYNDRRSAQEVAEIDAVSQRFQEKVGYRFNASYALPRLVWLKRHEPQAWDRARYVAHAATSW